MIYEAEDCLQNGAHVLGEWAMRNFICMGYQSHDMPPSVSSHLLNIECLGELNKTNNMTARRLQMRVSSWAMRRTSFLMTIGVARLTVINFALLVRCSYCLDTFDVLN